MSRLRSALFATATAVVALGSVVALAGTANSAPSGASASPAASSATAALPGRWYAAAPYLMPEQNDPPDPVTVMKATGQKTFQLAFILDSGGCTPAWDGKNPVSTDTEAGKVIAAIRAAGGDVSISAGGYNGTKLGQGCADPAATAAAYQQVIDKYQLHAIDLDLEEPEYENSTAIANELGAAKILQQDNAGIYISITMPGTSAGTGWFGKQLLDKAKSIGFTPNNFSIMPFDGGFNGSAAQISALKAFNGILQQAYGWNEATAYAHEGVSLMNGRSDSAEYFYQSDFQAVLDFATGHGMARYTYWSVNRDRECTPPDNQKTLGTCSSVTQQPWDFTKFTAEFAGAAPPPTTTPPTTPPTTTTPPGSCSAPAWVATTAYTGGDTVSYGDHTWTAKWWTYGDTPGGSAGVWADDGPCAR